MSFAFYAAPIENFEDTTTKQKKRKNKTIKKDREIDNNKVNSILKKIHDSPDEENDELTDFKPMHSNISKKQNNKQQNNDNRQLNNEDESNNDEDVNVEDFNNGYESFESFQQKNSSILAENFDKLNNSYSNNNSNNIIPYYNNISEPSTSKDILVKKLNYLIFLLEEQRDSKTEHVTEELILYSFLGVFVIFIVDSFARVGKYVR